MSLYKICHACGGRMPLKVIDYKVSLNGEELTINDVEAYVCEKCGETVFDRKTAKEIENKTGLYKV